MFTTSLVFMAIEHFHNCQDNKNSIVRMKKIVFLSTMAFEANVSIIKRLRQHYEVYYIAMFNYGKCSLGFLDLKSDVTAVRQIKEFAPFHDYIDIDKSYIVKHPEGLTLKKFTVDFKVLNLVKKIKPDVILTDAANVCMLWPRFAFRKHVISLVHDPFPHSGEDTFVRVLANKLLVKFSSRYVLFNQVQKQEFINRYKVNPAFVFCTYLSTYEHLKVYDKLKVEKKDKLINILFYGRISPYKGIEYLLKAIRSFYQNGNNGIEVTVAGKGSFDFDISEYERLPYVHIKNTFIESSDLIKMIKESSAVICPYTDATQSGIVMTAYAFGKPVIATNVGGLPEMLNNGELGILIPPKNIKAIEDAFVKIKKNPSLLSDYSEKIKQVYENGNKSWNNAVSLLKNAIESLYL